jgi:hypothetical protein
VDLGKHSGVFGHLARVKKQRVDNHTPFIQSFTMFFLWGFINYSIYKKGYVLLWGIDNFRQLNLLLSRS